MIATTIDRREDEAVCVPAVCRLGLLGLGNVGGAVARLTREAAPQLSRHGLTPVVSAALVRTPGLPRPAAAFVGAITNSHDRFFGEPLDVVVEALGGIEPAFTLVRRALDRGIPVVTANKSLIAAHGDALARLARRRGTALRYDAACIAGVPFLGTFERRPLVSQAAGVTGILNGTTNYILTTMARGATFSAALADAQRLGYAEPDPSMDVSGADAAEKLAILVRLFGRLIADPRSIPLDGLRTVDPADIAAAAAFGGAMRPVSRASWNGRDLQAHVGPTFVAGTHPLARVDGVTNGVVIDARRGRQCYTGPGAGPEVTAETLLDDVSEIVREGRALPPAAGPARRAASLSRPESMWLLRVAGAGARADVGDLLGSFGVWCVRIERRGDRTYALSRRANVSRVTAALDALRASTGVAGAAFPALEGDAASGPDS